MLLHLLLDVDIADDTAEIVPVRSPSEFFTQGLLQFIERPLDGRTRDMRPLDEFRALEGTVLLEQEVDELGPSRQVT
jgi:hypothetical protein